MNLLRDLHTAKPHPIIYRDLKPENIIVMPDGKVKLVDLGTARCYKQESVHDTVLAGTKGYTDRPRGDGGDAERRAQRHIQYRHRIL